MTKNVYIFFMYIFIDAHQQLLLSYSIQSCVHVLVCGSFFFLLVLNGLKFSKKLRSERGSLCDSERFDRRQAAWVKGMLVTV